MVPSYTSAERRLRDEQTIESMFDNTVYYNLFFYFKVCIHHFHEEDIEMTIQFSDGLRMIETERKKVGLKKGAVPSIFPNCPSYLTDATVSCQRLSLYGKE